MRIYEFLLRNKNGNRKIESWKTAQRFYLSSYDCPMNVQKILFIAIFTLFFLGCQHSQQDEVQKGELDIKNIAALKNVPQNETARIQGGQANNVQVDSMSNRLEEGENAQNQDAQKNAEISGLSEKMEEADETESVLSRRIDELFDQKYTKYSKIMQVILRLDPCFMNKSNGYECELLNRDPEIDTLALMYIDHISEMDIQEFMKKDWKVFHSRLNEYAYKFKECVSELPPGCSTAGDVCTITSDSLYILLNRLNENISLYQSLKKQSLTDANRVLKNAVWERSQNNYCIFDNELCFLYSEWKHPFYSQKEILDVLDAGVDVNMKYERGRTLIYDIHDKKLYSEFMKRGADLTVTDEDGNTPIHQVIKKGEKEIISIILKNKSDMNIANYQGKTPIFEVGCDPDLLEVIISAGADIHVMDKEGKSLMSTYAECPDNIKIFVSHGLDINTEDKDGKTLLFYTGNLEQIKEYVALGADLKHKDKAENSLFHQAIMNSEVIEYYLQAGLNVNVKNNQNESPIELACYYLNHFSHYWDEKCLDLLIKSGADVNDIAITKYLDVCGVDSESIERLLKRGYQVNRVPEHLIAKMYDLSKKWLWYYHHDGSSGEIEKYKDPLDAMERLIPEYIRLGLDVSEKDENENTYLFYAENRATIEALIQAGIDVNSQNKDGDTAVFCRGYSPNVMKLIEAGADVNHRNKQGITPIFSYIINYPLQRFGFPYQEFRGLVEAGADVNAKDKSGTPIIIKLADAEHADGDESHIRKSIKLMIQRGLNMNATDKKGRTPLMVYEDHVILEMLVKAGADIYAKDKSGKSVKQYHDSEYFKRLEEIKKSI